MSALAASALVAALVLALALPRVLADWMLTPDAIEYLAIAHAFASGAGFVDPVVYTYFLPPQYPMPAAAMRPPLWPLLLAFPLSLGATIQVVQGLHVALAAAVAAGVLQVARRFASLPAALAVAIGFGGSYGWISLAQIPLTEVTSVALLLGLIALAPAALASTRGALGFALLGVLAWLCRPNLALALPALLAAAATGPEPLRALRTRAPWLSAAVFVVLVVGVVLAVRAATGLAPYAHHGFLLESLAAEDGRSYQHEFAGPLAFLRANAADVLRLLRWNASEVARALLLSPDFHFVGWLAVPALARALSGRGATGAVERRFVAWFTLAQLPALLLTPGSVEPRRLSLFVALGGWLLAAELLDALAAAAARRSGTRALRLLPLALVALLIAGARSTPAQIRDARAAWRAYAAHGTRARHPWWARAVRLCPLLEPDALVASPDPWSIHLWCGSLGVWLPVDLDSGAVLDRYLDEQAPGYLVVEDAAAPAALRESPRLSRVGAADGFAVYRLRDAPPRSRPWRAPPPLAAASDIPPERGDAIERRSRRVR